MRQDFHVRNEANSLLLYAGGEGVPSRDEILRNLSRSVSEGRAIRVELVQDDSFNVRFVDEDLSEQEQTEWVGRVECNLRLPSGVLALSAGLETGEEGEGAGSCRVDVSPGEYHVVVYSYFPGVNGEGCLRKAGNRETLGEWFRRTRSGEAMPPWLAWQLAEDPSGDPGHEREWESFLVSEAFAEAQRAAQASPTIDLLVHLLPLAPGDECRNKGRKGALPATSNARRPDRFPLGLSAPVAAATIPSEFVWQPKSPQAIGILGTVPQAVRLTDGTSVLLSIASLHTLARIPAWCDAMTWAILLIGSAKRLSPESLGVTPSFYLGIEEDTCGLLVSLKPRDKLAIGASMRDIEKALARLPDGTTLECVWGDYTAESNAGNQRYRGTLRGGEWEVNAAYPPMSSQTLAEAVDFAACLDDGYVKAGSAREAEKVLDLCREVMPDWVAVVEPRADGGVLRLGMDDAGELWNLARIAFAVRYAGTWSAWEWWKLLYPGIRPWETD